MPGRHASGDDGRKLLARAGRAPLQDAPHHGPPPAGFIRFCVNFPDQCATPKGGSTVVPLTTSTLQRLRAINRHINRAIWPEDDATHYGRPEFWTIPTDGMGDCDDYAVTKRAVLIAAGLRPRLQHIRSTRCRVAIVDAPLQLASSAWQYRLTRLGQEHPVEAPHRALNQRPGRLRAIDASNPNYRSP
jgi:hypothetical protein